MDEAELRGRGFQGFVSVRELWEDTARVPELVGVYAVLRIAAGPPEFLGESTGGWFKGKDPSVSIGKLEKNWVPGSSVIYVGKAGKVSGRPTLRARIRQYLEFGQGIPVGHWGGRYIWQLRDAPDLQLSWKETPGQDPRDLERAMLEEFRARNDRLPFANLRL